MIKKMALKDVDWESMQSAWDNVDTDFDWCIDLDFDWCIDLDFDWDIDLFCK